MTIHEIRQAALKLVYEWDMGGEGGNETLFGLLELKDEKDVEAARAMFDNTVSHIDEIDDTIKQQLRDWSMERVSKVDLAILRLSAGEMLFKDLAPGIAINEALILAEEFSGDRSRAFINGVLGSIARAKREN